MYRSYSVNNMPELVRYQSVPPPQESDKSQRSQNRQNKINAQSKNPSVPPEAAGQSEYSPQKVGMPKDTAYATKNKDDFIIANIKADDIILIAVILILLMDDCDDIILIAALGLVLFSDYFGF